MGCENCEHAPTTYEEYCMAFAHPEQYCSDAYSSDAVHCNKYNKERNGIKMSDVELVIKIPEEYYNDMKNTSCWWSGLKKCVLNGTSLSKGHGRLIDVSEYFKKEFGDAREFLDKATTIIEADKAGREE